MTHDAPRNNFPAGRGPMVGSVMCAACRGFVPRYYVGSTGAGPDDWRCFECWLAARYGRRDTLDLRHVEPLNTGPVVPAVEPERLRCLTRRQRALYERLAVGLSVAAIARADHLDERALRKTVARIRARLEKGQGVGAAPACATVAHTIGFVPAPCEPSDTREDQPNGDDRRYADPHTDGAAAAADVHVQPGNP